MNSAEEILVENAKTDPIAFGHLYDTYYPKIFSYALHRTADILASEDITADVFYKAYIKRSSYTSRGLSYSSWLYRIASNEIANHFRKRSKNHFSLDQIMLYNGYDPRSLTNLEEEVAKLEQELWRHQEFIEIQKILAQLPIKYQEVITLQYFEEKKLEEIAHITGKKLGTVKSLLSRGLQKLRVAQSASNPINLSK